jgi:hypothetical protein
MNLTDFYRTCTETIVRDSDGTKTLLVRFGNRTVRRWSDVDLMTATEIDELLAKIASTYDLKTGKLLG